MSQLQNCADLSGVCFCKDNVIGDKCNACRDQTFNITIDNDYGCSGLFYLVLFSSIHRV